MAEFFPGTSANEFCKDQNEKKTLCTIQLNVEESDRMPLFPATQN